MKPFASAFLAALAVLGLFVFWLSAPANASETNTAALGAALERAANEQDRAGVMALFSDDSTVTLAAAPPAPAHTYRGADEVERFWDTAFREHLQFTPASAPVLDGARAVWAVDLTSRQSPEAGTLPAEQTEALEAHNGRITAWTLTTDASTLVALAGPDGDDDAGARLALH